MDHKSISANERKWKDFLSSIKTYKCLSTNKSTITTERDIECLATTFASKLLQEKDDNVVVKGNQDVPQTDTNEHVKETSAQSVDSRDDNTDTPSKKNDMDIPSSKWSISKLAEYFIFENCVTKIEMLTTFSSYPNDIYEMVQKGILRRLQIVKSIDLKDKKYDSYSNFLRQLMSIVNIETGSRLVLDALLVPLCSALGLQLELEKTINCNDLPKCKLDYCIRKGEHIIGCVEAKSVNTLSNSSIAQAILQLMVLQKTLLRTETPTVDISTFPVFAIVTDGHRFIYIQLKGSSLGFEHDGDKLRIRKVKEEGDFKDILHHIRFLVEGDQSVTS